VADRLMDDTSVGSDGPAETDSGIESSSTSGASCDTLTDIRVAIPALDIQVINSHSYSERLNDMRLLTGL